MNIVHWGKLSFIEIIDNYVLWKIIKLNSKVLLCEYLVPFIHKSGNVWCHNILMSDVTTFCNKLLPKVSSFQGTKRLYTIKSRDALALICCLIGRSHEILRFGRDVCSYRAVLFRITTIVLYNWERVSVSSFEIKASNIDTKLKF